METIIVYLSVIPWIFYYSINIFKTLIDMDKKRTLSLFRFDSVILILIFIYFVYFNKTFVIQMLFATMNLYFFINRLYEKNINRKNIKNVFKKNKCLLTVLYIFMILFIVVFERLLKLSYFYYCLFALSFFINVIIYGLKRLKIFK